MPLSNPNRFLTGVVDQSYVKIKPKAVSVVVMPGPKGDRGSSGGGSGGGLTTQKVILSNQDIANKKVVLGAVPDTPSEVTLEVVGAPTQNNSVDFEVVGSEVRWGSLALELILEAGDTIVVKYSTT